MARTSRPTKKLALNPVVGYGLVAAAAARPGALVRARAARCLEMLCEFPSDSLRCERCGIPAPVAREKCDGPCARWIGKECYIEYGQDDVFCLDCRHPEPPPAQPLPNAAEAWPFGGTTLGKHEGANHGCRRVLHLDDRVSFWNSLKMVAGAPHPDSTGFGLCK